MTANSRLAEILDDLIDRWCERRALDPLRILLAAWPASGDLTEDWHLLWQQLLTLNGLRPGILTAEERELQAEALRLVNKALRAVGHNPAH
jgi:hypothetical protein